MKNGVPMFVIRECLLSMILCGKAQKKMAYSVMEGVLKEGVEAKLFKLSVADLTDLMREVLEAKGIILGSPTLNNGLLPTVAGFLQYMKGL